MDFHKLTTRFRQFGGMRLVLQYAKLGALAAIVKGIVSCVVKRHSYQFIYPEVLKRIEPMLIAKYGSRVQEFKKFNGSRKRGHEHPKVIWWCWLQGKEQSPPIVQACFASLHRNLVHEFNDSSEDGYEIRVIDAENWKDYVELPDYIVKKWEKKQIPPALFTDLLRLHLLIRYGGTWIDSTVLCTGMEHTKEYLDSDFFMFQYRAPETSTASFEGISNWFITSCTNNEILLVLRDMLFAYWKDYDCTLYYFIFHVFFSMIAKEYPVMIANMPYGYSVWSLTLENHWGEPFNQRKWDKLTSLVNFHKLYYRVGDNMVKGEGNYYHWILENYK